MNRAIPYSIATLLAAGGMSLAFAQTDKDVNRADTNANPNAPAPVMNLVKEPVASASTTQGAQGELVGSIVQALNADPSLQQSKISVQPVEGKVVLSGVTHTQAQKKRAVEVAASQAGETEIVDAIQSDDV